MGRVVILPWIERFIPFGRMVKERGRGKKWAKRLSFFGKLGRIITTLTHEEYVKRFSEIMDEVLTMNHVLCDMDC